MLAVGKNKIVTSGDKKKGKAESIDGHVGNQLRQRRALMGMTQEHLADSVGITFQQIQKYENGANRVSAGRLFEFSKILEVPVSFFFENFIPGADGKKQALHYGLSDSGQSKFEGPDNVMDLKETTELVRVYYSIQDPKLRKNLFNFLKTMAESLKEQDDK
jgi:transcriptional regulator with XRE-family HTH domain